MLNARMRKTEFTIRWIAASCALFFAGELFTVASFAQAPPSYPPQELERLVSPIALYPDPLLAQILTASTFLTTFPTPRSGRTSTITLPATPWPKPSRTTNYPGTQACRRSYPFLRSLI